MAYLLSFKISALLYTEIRKREPMKTGQTCKTLRKRQFPLGWICSLKQVEVQFH